MHPKSQKRFWTRFADKTGTKPSYTFCRDMSIDLNTFYIYLFYRSIIGPNEKLLGASSSADLSCWITSSITAGDMRMSADTYCQL